MSGATNGYTPITAPPSAAPRLSLVASAVEPDDETGGRWVNGLAFEPEACLPGDDRWWDCPIPPSGTEPEPKDIPDGEPVEEYRPWTAWVGDRCSLFGWEERDGAARARRLYASSEPRMLERELWRGDVAQAADFPNRYLADPTRVTDLGEAPGLYALGELQQSIADRQTGRGMIHCTVRTANFWLSASVIRREGNLLLDALDNIVVAGTGYDGSEPDGVIDPTGDTQFAYATGLVQVRRDTSSAGQLQNGIMLLTQELAENVDRDVNDLEFRAERIVAAYWDGCVHTGIRVNLCSPCCSPGTGS